MNLLHNSRNCRLICSDKIRISACLENEGRGGREELQRNVRKLVGGGNRCVYNHDCGHGHIYSHQVIHFNYQYMELIV